MSESAFVHDSGKTVCSDRPLSAFRPTVSLVAALVLSLLPFVDPHPGATYQLFYKGVVVGEGQHDAAGLFYAVPALVLVLRGLVMACRGKVRGPRTVHAALFIAVGGVAWFQLARTFGFL